MKEYKLTNKTIRIYEQHEALVASGSDEADDPFEQDAAFESFFGDCVIGRIVWNPSTYNEQLTQLVKDGVDVVIIMRE